VANVETDYEQVLGEAETMLDEVDAALGRLADGSYGMCVTCGERIDDERLAESPTTGTCDHHTVRRSDPRR
jgi:RNA polymerase-binding transcription factor DksA